MPEPRIDPDFADITFRDHARRPPARENATSLFWTGVAIFLGVALVYPFYSYQVQARLLVWEMEAAMEEVGVQVDEAVASSARQSAAARAETVEANRQSRLRGIHLAGSTVVGGQPLVIVNFGQASFAEARETICQLAERRFQTSLAGQKVRVQRSRGNAPAQDVGTVRCD